MEQNNFKVSTDYRGHHWKGIRIDVDTEVSLQQKCMF